MPKPLVADELWALIHPLLPHETPKGGRLRGPDRDTFEGILYALMTLLGKAPRLARSERLYPVAPRLHSLMVFAVQPGCFPLQVTLVSDANRAGMLAS